jgi:hypothetical protein
MNGHAETVEAEVAQRKRIEARPFPPDIESGAGSDRPGVLEFLSEVGKQLCEAGLARGKKPMAMPRLRRFGPGLRLIGEGIAVEDIHTIEMAGKHLGRGKAADPGADDNGLFSWRVRH